MKSAVRFARALGVVASLLASPHGQAQTGTAPIVKIETVAPKDTGSTHYVR